MCNERKRKCKRGNNFESLLPPGTLSARQTLQTGLNFPTLSGETPTKVVKVVTLVRNSSAVGAAPLSLDAINEQTKANHN